MHLHTHDLSQERFEASGTLPKIPLIVFARGLDDSYPTFSDEEAAQTNQLWHQLQRDLVNLVPECQPIIAE